MSKTIIRADVQGLRGVAVLLVVLYHAGVPGLPGGFIGVDVFFVISGFLITGLLVDEARTSGRIDIAEFFARRARRLLPAALVLIVATVIAALWFYPPLEQREIVSAARAASVYLANQWLAGRAVNYLTGAAHANPLLHMWSLAVEEQFYLVWPLVIALGMRVARGARHAHVIGALCVVSFVACVAMTWRAQPWAFFSMPFRAWEFGLGALVRLALPGPAAFRRDSWPRAIGAVGAGMVGASVAWLDAASLFPGILALLPTLGTALVLLGIHRSSGGVGTFLAMPPLRWLGDLSYSWYLWHWPILVFSRELFAQRAPLTTIAALGLSILLAMASFRWVETPIRANPPPPLRKKKGTLVIALGASLAVAAACTALGTWISLRGADPLQKRFADATQDIPRIYASGCHAAVETSDLPRCAFGLEGAATKIVLLGDSHAAQWFPALERLAIERGWQLVSLTKSACPAADLSVRNTTLRRTYHECDQWRERMFKRIEVERPALVVIGNSSRHAPAAQWQAAVSRSAERLDRLGVAHVWLRDTPWPGFDGPRCLARAHWQGRTDAEQLCAFDRDRVMAAAVPIFDAERAALASSSHGRTLDMTEAICAEPRCTVLRAGQLVYSDNHHITASWARRQAGRLGAALQALGPAAIR